MAQGEQGRKRKWGWKRWTVIGVAAALLLFVGGPYVYIHFIEGPAPAPLTLGSHSPGADPATTGGDPTGSGSTGGAGDAEADGTWGVNSDSIVGYRIKEQIFGQSQEAVGRTSEITGSVTIGGTSVTDGSFTVDMTSVTSDESRRDDQFNGRIMETSTFPEATFVLTKPIDLGSIPADGSQQAYRATGELTLHGVTNTVTFDVDARRTGTTFEVAGSIPVTFADYGIGNPSFGFVTTEDHGLLEFDLLFDKNAS
jgi:polyisoprenoid-binding protein YceI